MKSIRIVKSEIQLFTIIRDSGTKLYHTPTPLTLSEQLNTFLENWNERNDETTIDIY